MPVIPIATRLLRSCAAAAAARRRAARPGGLAARPRRARAPPTCGTSSCDARHGGHDADPARGRHRPASRSRGPWPTCRCRLRELGVGRLAAEADAACRPSSGRASIDASRQRGRRRQRVRRRRRDRRREDALRGERRGRERRRRSPAAGRREPGSATGVRAKLAERVGTITGAAAFRSSTWPVDARHRSRRGGRGGRAVASRCVEATCLCDLRRSRTAARRRTTRGAGPQVVREERSASRR